jgi:hypothetical protein
MTGVIMTRRGPKHEIYGSGFFLHKSNLYGWVT